MIFRMSILPFLVILLSEYAVCAPGDVSFVVSSTEQPKGNDKKATEEKNDILTIYEMNVNSNVSNRFAKTLIQSKVKNDGTAAKEATFSVVLPEKAFISEFVMEIGGKSYKAYVKEKEEAKKIYEEAVSSGQSAAHVAVSARDSNRFTVSVNIEAESKGTFLLTYEELLERKHNQYELVLNIHPGQIVKHLNVEVNINETRPLVFVKTPSLRSGNEISKNEDKIDPSSSIEIINQTSAVVQFHPDAEKQREFAHQLGGKENEGLSGQFIVQYEVERDPHGGEVLLQDGYFVHFFAPKDAEPLPKNVYFILDTSSSMLGIKEQQLRDAMMSILDEIKPEDRLSIVEFNSDTLVWNIQAETSLRVELNNFTNPYPELSKHEMPGPIPATKETIGKAKKLVSNMRSTGATYMIGGLEAGLYLVKSEKERSTTDKRQPIIIFLTDGQPNVGMYSTSEITDVVTRLNKEINVPIFSLSFGVGADKSFLRKLSLKNLGFSRHIYEASDASLQLQEFFKQISSPLLSDVHFKYDSDAKEVTRVQYPILFDGSEIVVAGRFNGKKFNPEIDAFGRRGPLILLPKVEEPVTSLERLWAYLTIKETLEKRETADDKKELTKKALDLALKYSFVTDVSSLVVVKPNATNAVDTEDASKPSGRPSWGQTSHLLGGPPGYPTANRVAFAGIPFSSRGASRDSYVSSFDSGISGGRRYHTLSSQSAYPVYYDRTTSHQFKMQIPPVSTTTTSTPRLVDSLSWLSSVLDQNNGTLVLPEGVYQLGLMSLQLPVGDKCPKTPKGEKGQCTLLKDCPEVFALLTNFDVYKQYFCPMQSKYAGVCCPKKN